MKSYSNNIIKPEVIRDLNSSVLLLQQQLDDKSIELTRAKNSANLAIAISLVGLFVSIITL